MDGVGLAASFNSPWGIAVDSFGNLYVADRGNNKIRKVAPTGVVSTLAGSGALAFTDGQGAAASFNVPQGVAVDASGNIFIADSTNCAIRKISPSGLVSTLVGTPTTCGRITSIDGTGSQASFDNPTALTATADGTIFVADTYNHVVRQVSPTAVVTSLPTTAAAALPALYGIASDSAGNLYYPDSNSQRVFKVATNGAVTVLAGSGATGSDDGPGNSATFTSPYGIAVDSRGNVYVSEGSRIIRKISRDGRVVTIAGTPFVGGATDGSGPAALFDLPSGLAVDMAGNIYVSDNLNNNVRKIEAR